MMTAAGQKDQIKKGSVMEYGSKNIMEAEIITKAKLRNPCYQKIVCSISGGADSDILIDLIVRLDKDKKVKYIFFNTGMEYKATKEHIGYLKEKYQINIEEIKPEKPIPLCCKRYGQPFLSKQISEWIMRLQKHGFKWEDESFEVLLKKYPKCRAALKWWCNQWDKRKNGKESSYNIAYTPLLKEFMMKYPPDFQISNKCCHYTKKLLAARYKVKNQIDLSMTGIRKAERGARQQAYKNCFTADVDGTDEYRPIFWFLKKDKEIYCTENNIKHSDCYTKYGLDRTGCACCPYGKDFEKELEAARKYEPNLFNAALNVFGKSYEYTKKFYEFRKESNHYEGI